MSNEKLDRLIEELPEQFNYHEKHVSNVTKECMRQIRNTGLGLYTFRFNQMFGRADNIYFCRVESLRSDLISFFESIGALSDGLRNYVLDLEKKNASEHAHYSMYYTTDLAELVFVRDRLLIDRFHYTFDRASTRELSGEVIKKSVQVLLGN